MSSKNYLKEFSIPLLQWFRHHGRKNLPWQKPRDAYRVWVSEIMLQQTQVQTVINYFNRFIEQFPTIFDLAIAQEDTVFALWSGLGYYSRARNLHKSAQLIVSDYQGIFPQTLNELIELPGIGPSTAAAILSQAFNLPTPILDGNVKRVLSRFFMIKGYPEQAAVKKIFWDYAHACMPEESCADYTQAIMDLGALCCTNKNPNCTSCPVKKNCLAFINDEQCSFPTKKIKKPVPTLQQQFLVLTNREGQIYLEKRPPTGLWGGLWCFPGIDVEDCPLAFIRLNYALNGVGTRDLISFKHKFSHFHLEIKAVGIETIVIKDKLFESKGRWFNETDLNTVGLAKPTSRILAQLFL